MVVKIVTCAALSLLILMSGCGYRLATQSPSGNRSISIPVYANKAVRPNLESCLTSRLVDQFARSSGTIVVKPGQADLELTGAILEYNEFASAFTADDQTAMYQLSMTAESSLQQVKSGLVLWKGISRAVQDYSTSSDLALKINAQEAALNELCRKIAEDIDRQIGSRF